MPAACAPAGGREVLRPPIRIRTVLLALVGLWLGWSSYHRAVAAWRLHGLATTLANYGLCMVGPTGPSLLRDNQDEFLRLVRRRLVASVADDRPFSGCAKMGRELADSERTERAHQAKAADFVEYGMGHAAGSSVTELAVSTRPLAELSGKAWPFVRGGYMRLVRPSSRTREALHPIALPKPALGRGLPSWRAQYRAVQRTEGGFVLAVGSAANLSVYKSQDEGLTWRHTSRSGVKHFAERCSGPDARRAFTFELSDDASTTVVLSHVPEREVLATTLAPSEHEVFAAACDDETLVAALRPEDRMEVTLYRCRHRERCQPMLPPKFSAAVPAPRYPIDIARVAGATIVAVSHEGIVRVASSRDDGETWTPFAVAFDRAAYPELGTNIAIADRLLVLEGRVLLYGGAKKASHTYPVLLSDDYGASWRSP